MSSNYTNSPLVGYTRLVNKHSGRRTHSIDRITPHCVVGQVTAARLGDIFSGTREPYAFKQVVYDTLIKLCIDICRRNNKKRLLWFGDKAKTLNYSPKSDEMVLTVHRWFCNKSCPGDWMYARMGDLAAKVTEALAEEVIPAPKPAVRCPYAEPETLIRYGSRGVGVRWVQWNLNHVAGEKLVVDGIFGVLTRAAVLRFQRKRRLATDGIVGPITRAAINKERM